MVTVEVRLPADLIRAAGLNPSDPSADASRLLALTLYKENRVSLARAAELCETSVEQFVEFAGRQGDPLPYGVEQLEEDRRTIDQLGY